LEILRLDQLADPAIIGVRRSGREEAAVDLLDGYAII
jgi:hypothetical protein